MIILVVEDDLFKYSKIEGLIREVLHSVEVVKCDNVYNCITYLSDSEPDKIILDMSLPSHAAEVGQGSPLSMPTGGIEIILELRSVSKSNMPIIVLTQYPEIEIENEYYSIEDAETKIKELYSISCLSVVLYENDSDDWMIKTIEFLRQ